MTRSPHEIDGPGPRLASAFVALAVSALTPCAAAQPNPGSLPAFLEDTRATCGPTPAAQSFVSALDVELSTFEFVADPSLQVVSCHVETGQLILEWAGHKFTLDVSDVPLAARPRTLAVALAETLRLPPSEGTAEATAAASATALTDGSGSEPLVSPARDASAPLSTAPSSAPVQPPKLTSPTPELDACAWQTPFMLRGLVMGPAQTLALGGTLGASFTPIPWLRLGSQVGYLTAHDRSVYGEARLHAATLEATLDATVLRPGRGSTLTVGVGATAVRALVLVDSAWGVNERDVAAWFALWSMSAGLTTAISDDVNLLTSVSAIKDLVGRRFEAGGRDALSFYGFGAELRLGMSYAW